MAESLADWGIEPWITHSRSYPAEQIMQLFSDPADMNTCFDALTDASLDGHSVIVALCSNGVRLHAEPFSQFTATGHEDDDQDLKDFEASLSSSSEPKSSIKTALLDRLKLDRIFSLLIYLDSPGLQPRI